MKKWIQYGTILSVIAGVAAGSGSASAAGSAAGQVYIDGSLQQGALIVNGRTLVQLRALDDPSWLTYSYDAKTKTVKAASKDKSKVIELKEGRKTALVNGKEVALDVSVVIQAGRTYVPLRFVGDNMGAYVSYNAAKKRTIVRTPKGQKDYDTLMKGDLEAARTIAVHVPKYYPDGQLESQGEGFSFTYLFPEGEALRFQTDYRQLTSDFVIDGDGIAEAVYQQYNPYGEKAVVKGTKPADTGKAWYYFMNNFMSEYTWYGKIDVQGQDTRIADVSWAEHPEYKNKVIFPIEGEQRTDGKQ
ncbi:copper amine oxidase N-terminal domain-containing protein [Cohnella sp. 56]|uniref:copper amine oxidase N-terminal domain-containing protein n=1 Tax=Cohnella sp. 56 TaxID=3113722 RepID=UPI0030EAF11D